MLDVWKIRFQVSHGHKMSIETLNEAAMIRNNKTWFGFYCLLTEDIQKSYGRKKSIEALNEV